MCLLCFIFSLEPETSILPVDLLFSFLLDLRAIIALSLSQSHRKVLFKLLYFSKFLKWICQNWYMDFSMLYLDKGLSRDIFLVLFTLMASKCGGCPSGIFWSGVVVLIRIDSRHAWFLSQLLCHRAIREARYNNDAKIEDSISRTICCVSLTITL